MTYFKTFLRPKNIQPAEDVQHLRIRNQTTAPTSKLVPPKVEGLDALSKHDSRVVEDECDVS